METSLFGLSPATLHYALAGGGVGLIVVLWIVVEAQLKKRYGFEDLPLWTMVAAMLPAGLVNALIRDVWPLEPMLGWPRSFVVYGLFFFAVQTWLWARKRRRMAHAA